ncbi:MAG: sugar phosphate isomerase/epimerase [Thermoleophilia bacterium]|nr:sugar phosphate isomerase/epimerase [Thermoleophilia bacterium]
MADPKFSISEITTFHQTFEQDLETYREAGIEGIGIWEFKLGEGRDADALARLRDSGLKATTIIPGTLSIWPVPFPGPTDPEERTEGLCAAIRRFAPFEPEVILCLTGDPGDGVDAAEKRRVAVNGLRRAARVAADHGLTLGLEPLHREVYGTWSIIGDIPGTIDLLDEIGEPNVKLLFDVYHLWDTDDVLEHTVRHGDRIVPSVHVCDWRDPTRNDFDRVLPGDGIIDLPAIFGALDAAGVVGWFDLEIFSDDGSFSDLDFEDSLWKQDPLEVVRRGKAGFERAWAARKAPG